MERVVSGKHHRNYPTGGRRVTVLRGVTSLTAKQRLRVAIANDNGGDWFLADSRYRVAELERMFAKGRVGSILYERIGGLLEGSIRPYIYIQILLVTDVIDGIDYESREPIWKQVKSYAAEEKWPDWTVEQCLKDLGIEIRDEVNLQDVLYSRQY